MEYKNIRGNIKERNVCEKNKVGMIVDMFGNKQHNGGFLLLEMPWKRMLRGSKKWVLRKGSPVIKEGRHNIKRE